MKSHLLNRQFSIYHILISIGCIIISFLIRPPHNGVILRVLGTLVIGVSFSLSSVILFHRVRFIAMARLGRCVSLNSQRISIEIIGFLSYAVILGILIFDNTDELSYLLIFGPFYLSMFFSGDIYIVDKNISNVTTTWVIDLVKKIQFKNSIFNTIVFNIYSDAPASSWYFLTNRLNLKTFIENLNGIGILVEAEGSMELP